MRLALDTRVEPCATLLVSKILEHPNITRWDSSHHSHVTSIRRLYGVSPTISVGNQLSLTGKVNLEQSPGAPIVLGSNIPASALRRPTYVVLATDVIAPPADVYFAAGAAREFADLD